ncbi:MAG: PfkB family carbohydrate kinase, partial [Rhodospirillales bacterium]
MNAPTTEALAVLDRLGRARVLVVGDVMLDRFVYGTVDRISPEGPIGILRVRREMAVPGGAGNVVRNLAAWGVRATLVSVVGADAAGAELRQLLAREPALRVVMLRDRNRETTIKTRYIAGAQQLLRA